MHILGFIFILIIAVFLIGISLIGSILRAIFGFGRRSGSTPYTTTTSGDRRQQPDNSWKEEDEEEAYDTNENGYPHRHKKIFTKDDGEYVDFEEIK